MNAELLAEADQYVDALVGGEDENWLAVVGLVGRLANALRAATAEMHSRELHHFETEKMLVEAGIDPDRSTPDSRSDS